MCASLPDVSIRLATPDDAAALAIFGRRTFSDTFAADNTAADMALFLDTTYGEVQQRIELADPALTCLVAASGGTICASALLQAGTDADGVPSATAIELRRFYVDRAMHGNGLAQAMLAACVAHAHSRKCRRLFLGVWERNLRAIRFYEKHGFSAIGEKTFVLGRDPQRDIVMARELAVAR